MKTTRRIRLSRPARPRITSGAVCVIRAALLGGCMVHAATLPQQACAATLQVEAGDCVVGCAPGEDNGLLPAPDPLPFPGTGLTFDDGLRGDVTGAQPPVQPAPVLEPKTPRFRQKPGGRDLPGSGGPLTPLLFPPENPRR